MLLHASRGPISLTVDNISPPSLPSRASVHSRSHILLHHQRALDKQRDNSVDTLQGNNSQHLHTCYMLKIESREVPNGANQYLSQEFGMQISVENRLGRLEHDAGCVKMVVRAAAGPGLDLASTIGLTVADGILIATDDARARVSHTRQRDERQQKASKK